VKKRQVYFAFSLLFILYISDYASRMVIVSLFPFLKENWGISDAQCGMMVSAVYWSITVLTFPISILIDRWSRRKAIGIMAGLWTLATALCAATSNFTQLFIARCLVGVGEAGYAPGGTAMISALFPQEKRALIMGFWNMSIPLGSALGMVVGGFIAVKYGWQQAFLWIAVPGLVVSVLFFFVKDYETVQLVKTDEAPDQTDATAAPAGTKMSFKDKVREFTGTPSVMFTFFAFACCTFVTTAMISWLPTYYERMEGLTMDKASMKGSLVMLSALVGAPLGGFLADYWQKRRANARMLFASLATLTTALFLGLAFWVFDGTVEYITLMFGGAAAVAFLPGAAAVTQDVIHPGLRAISYAICVIVQNLLGSSLGPLFVGAVSDQVGLAKAMSTLPFFMVGASILFFIGSFWYARDLAKVAKVNLNFET